MKNFRLAIAIGAVLGILGSLMSLPAAAAPMSLSDSLPVIMFGGMIVNKEAIQSVFTGLKTIFNNVLTAVKGTWQDTTMEVPSDSAGEDYAWLSRFPKMRKWVGSKVLKNIEAKKYYVANEDWETTLAVKRNDIEDDRLGIYTNQAQMAGASAAELWDIISDDLKNNAFTKLCFDGQYFYDTDHPVGDTTVSNKGTAALSAATLAAAQASYGAARLAIMSLKDEEGMPLRLVPDTLEVPPALEATARLLLEKEKLADDSQNPFFGTAKVKVNPGLTSSTAWFLHVTSKPGIKPFIVQMRKRPVFVSQTDLTSDDVFDKGEYKFGAEARAAGLYGFWQLSYGSTGAG